MRWFRTESEIPIHGHWTLRHAQRLALDLSLALLLVAGAILTSSRGGAAGFSSVAFASSAASGGVSSPSDGAHSTVPAAVFYGADTARTNAAIASIWPQYSGPYCGIVSAEAAVNYDDEVHGVGMRFSGRGAQSSVAAANQRSGASRWGYATPTNVQAGITNIAPDYGVDPRSIAYMTYNYTPNNTYFHDYIYRWQFANGAQPSFYTQVQQATTSVARALGNWHEPVTVLVNGGLHAVLVTGIYTYTNPYASYPAQIASVVYRDPQAWPSMSRFQVSFATWAGGHFSTPFGVYSLWSIYYGDRYSRGDGLNSSDREPTVGPYRPTSASPVHWYRGFTWIQRDNHWANGTYSPDYAYRSSGALMTSP
ncbi:MAG TPA: hypothetical protein VF739_07070 [Ktedonobacterales bacterium]